MAEFDRDSRYSSSLPEFLSVQRRASNEPVHRPDLGARCHFNQNTNCVPVFVITDLKGNILASNDIVSNDKRDVLNYWLVTGVKTTVTRFFSSSTATIILTCQLPDMSSYTPIIPDSLLQERDICIWGGYIDSMRPVTKEDLTVSLLRVFVGIIDTVQFTGTGTGGVTLALSCRDRIRWLMDTSNTFDVGSLQGDNIPRSQLILQIAQKGVGYIDQSIPGSIRVPASNKDVKRLINKGEGQYVHDIALEREKEPVTAVTDIPSFEAIYISNLLDNKQSGPLAGNTRCTLEVNRDPSFYIYTTRVGISTQNTAQLMIKQQHPIDMIKTLTMQEAYPTDMFQHHVDGNFYYYPRGSDFNSLWDPYRYFRTYFFRTVPSIVGQDIQNFSTGGGPKAGFFIPLTGIDFRRIDDGSNYELRYDAEVRPVSGPGYIPGTELVQQVPDDELISKLSPEDKKRLFEDNSNTNTIQEYSRNIKVYFNVAINDVNAYTVVVGFPNKKGFTKTISTAANGSSVLIINLELSEIELDNISAKVSGVVISRISNGVQKTSIGYFYLKPSPKKKSIKIDSDTFSLPNATITKPPILFFPPDTNQMLVSLRYEQSSIGVFTNFILYKSNTQEQLVTTEWTMHLELIPEAFYGRDGNRIPIANKFVRIEDPNIKSPAEGAAVLLNAARVYARGTQVASIVLNGDPSIVPGEIFQIFGSPILKNDGLSSFVTDRISYYKMQSLSLQSFQSLAVATSVTNKENATSTEPTNVNSNLLIDPTTQNIATQEDYNKLSAEDKAKYTRIPLYNAQIITTGLDQGKSGDKPKTSDQILTQTSSSITRDKDKIIPEPKTIFRAEAVAHKFNIGGSRGYLTEVSLTVPFMFTLFLLGTPLLNIIQHLSNYYQ